MTTLRTATTADADRLRTIQQQALAEPSPELLDAGIGGPLPLFVAVADAPVGYALLVASDDVAYLPELAVHPAHQRDGHGARLVDYLVEHRPESELRVTVRAVDDGARAFYDSLGFDHRERVADHFDAGDGIVLGRRL